MLTIVLVHGNINLPIDINNPAFFQKCNFSIQPLKNLLPTNKQSLVSRHIAQKSVFIEKSFGNLFKIFFRI